MKFERTAPITGATIYRIKLPFPVTILGPNVLAGFILEPVNSPKKKICHGSITFIFLMYL